MHTPGGAAPCRVAVCTCVCTAAAFATGPHCAHTLQHHSILHTMLGLLQVHLSCNSATNCWHRDACPVRPSLGDISEILRGFQFFWPLVRRRVITLVATRSCPSLHPTRCPPPAPDCNANASVEL